MNQENNKIFELLENSNSLVIERNGKNVTMPHPIEIYEKFTSVVPSDNIRISYQGKEMLEDEGLKYGIDKYMFIAELPLVLDFDRRYEHKAKVGIIVANKSNVMKVFAGMEASACLNMSVFRADSLQEEKVLPNVVKDMTLLSKKEIDTQVEQWKIRIQKLIDTRYNPSEFDKVKGRLLSTVPSSLFSYVIHAEKQLRDKNSIYSDIPDSDWKLLSAMTDLNKQRGLLNRVNEILQLESLFI